MILGAGVVGIQAAKMAAGLADQFHPGKKVGDFDRRGFRRVGPVDGVFTDAFGEFRADGALCRIGRVRGTSFSRVRTTTGCRKIAITRPRKIIRNVARRNRLPPGSSPGLLR